MTTMTTITISTALAARLEANAQAKGQSVEEMITDLIIQEPVPYNAATQSNGSNDTPEHVRVEDMFGLMGDIGRTDLSENLRDVMGDIIVENYEHPD